MWFEELGGLMSISCHVGVTWRQSSRWKSLMVIVFIYGWFNAGMIIFKKLCKNNPPKICSLCYFLSIQRNLCFFFWTAGLKMQRTERYSLRTMLQDLRWRHDCHSEGLSEITKNIHAGEQISKYLLSSLCCLFCP